MKLPTFTLGIEEEFMVIDPETRALRSHISEMIKAQELELPKKISRELHQSVIEIGSKICESVAEARHEVSHMRATICRVAEAHGLRIGAAGTHPFTNWEDVATTENARYDKILDDLRVVARANVVFGLHVHIGIEDREKAIQVFNMARYFTPHIMALSVNSPFWSGRDTGWKSYRTKVFEKFPRTGVPEAFRSYNEYQSLVNDLVRTNSIDNGKMIWWDIRPHWQYPTLEFRCCDVPMRVDETICIAALCQALVAKLYLLHERNLSFRLHRRSLIMENKWRAARWGVSGNLIDLGEMAEKPTCVIMEELLEFVDEVVDELGSRKELEYLRRICQEGTGADRQLQTYAETGDLKAVVDRIIVETQQGLPRG